MTPEELSEARRMAREDAIQSTVTSTLQQLRNIRHDSGRWVEVWEGAADDAGRREALERLVKMGFKTRRTFLGRLQVQVP